MYSGFTICLHPLRRQQRGFACVSTNPIFLYRLLSVLAGSNSNPSLTLADDSHGSVKSLSILHFSLVPFLVIYNNTISIPGFSRMRIYSGVVFWYMAFEPFMNTLLSLKYWFSSLVVRIIFSATSLPALALKPDGSVFRLRNSSFEIGEILSVGPPFPSLWLNEENYSVLNVLRFVLDFVKMKVVVFNLMIPIAIEELNKEMGSIYLAGS